MRYTRDGGTRITGRRIIAKIAILADTKQLLKLSAKDARHPNILESTSIPHSMTDPKEGAILACGPGKLHGFVTRRGRFGKT
jgi:hypothetical protein